MSFICLSIYYLFIYLYFLLSFSNLVVFLSCNLFIYLFIYYLFIYLCFLLSFSNLVVFLSCN